MSELRIDLHVDDREIYDLISHMQRLQNQEQKKRRFTIDENDRLRQLVEDFGSNNWELVASTMKDRTPRQCRDRWIYYLSPSLNNKEWTKEEDAELIELIKRFGKKWTNMVSFFDGRTEINIKNRWNLLQRTQKRRFAKYREQYKHTKKAEYQESESDSSSEEQQIEAEHNMEFPKVEEHVETGTCCLCTDSVSDIFAIESIEEFTHVLFDWDMNLDY